MGGLGSGERVGWRVHPTEELLDVVAFPPPLGESGTGEQSISPGADLRGDMPTGKLTHRCPWVRFPHLDLRSLTVAYVPGPHLAGPGYGCGFGREDGSANDGGARGGYPGRHPS